MKVNRIANLDADLALAMKASSVRIVAPIPGKGAVGVEIPNPQPEIVNLREILETPAFQGAKGELPLALGKDLNGRAYVANLAKMPHVLIAGATGSGKSVCLNTIVTSLVYKHTPGDAPPAHDRPQDGGALRRTRSSRTCATTWSPTLETPPVYSSGRCWRWSGATNS